MSIVPTGQLNKYQSRQDAAWGRNVTTSAPSVPDNGGEDSVSLFGSDGFDFWDVLDVVNPLQHIPVVSTIYRKITGDEMGAVAKIAGGALFGGGIGAAIEAADVAVDAITGKDFGEHTVAMFSGDDWPGDDENGGSTMLADASDTPAQTAYNATAPAPWYATAAVRAQEAPLPQSAPVDPVSTISLPALFSKGDTSPYNTPEGMAEPREAENAVVASIDVLANARRGQSGSKVFPIGEYRTRTVARAKEFNSPNMPIGGLPKAAISPDTIMKIAEAQGFSDVSHPLLKGGDRVLKSTEATQGNTYSEKAPNSDWFISAMENALDSYSDANLQYQGQVKDGWNISLDNVPAG